MRHPRDMLGAFLCAPPLLAGLHGSCQCHLRAGNGDLDFRGVHQVILGQPVTHILSDTFIGAHVAFRTTAAPAAPLVILVTTALRVLVSEPGGNFIRRPLQPAAILLVPAITAVWRT